MLTPPMPPKHFVLLSPNERLQLRRSRWDWSRPLRNAGCLLAPTCGQTTQTRLKVQFHEQSSDHILDSDLECLEFTPEPSFNLGFILHPTTSVLTLSTPQTTRRMVRPAAPLPLPPPLPISPPPRRGTRRWMMPSTPSSAQPLHPPPPRQPHQSPPPLLPPPPTRSTPTGSTGRPDPGTAAADVARNRLIVQSSQRPALCLKVPGRRTRHQDANSESGPGRLEPPQRGKIRTRVAGNRPPVETCSSRHGEPVHPWPSWARVIFGGLQRKALTDSLHWRNGAPHGMALPLQVTWAATHCRRMPVLKSSCCRIQHSRLSAHPTWFTPGPARDAR
jgi:hypothetical protein